MEELKVEYLILMDKEGAYCDSKQAFNKLLQVCSDIKISSNKIKYKSALDVDYLIKCGEVEGKDQRFFHVSFGSTCDHSNIDTFVSLLKDVKRVVHKAGGQPEILRDDVSSYYANLSYPKIHSIENLMRKLIATFMLRKVGKSWVKESSPTDFKSAIDNSKRKPSGYMNALYQVDFIHLSDFLFKPYAVNDVSKLFKKISDTEKVEDLDLDDLKDHIPRSNWFRYFSGIVECEDSYLSKRWSDLYELRCMVAHNSIVSKQEYEKIGSLIGDIEEKLEKAIQEIDKITIPEDDQELVAESVVSNINSKYGEFLVSWKNLDHLLKVLANSLNMTNRNATLKNGRRSKVMIPRHLFIQMLSKKNIFGDDEIVNTIKHLYSFRNQLVHEAVSLEAGELDSFIIQAKDCANYIASYVEKLEQKRVEVFLDDAVPEYMNGILRIGRVVVHDGEEAIDREDLVNNLEFSDENEIVDFICQEIGVAAYNVLIHE